MNTEKKLEDWSWDEELPVLTAEVDDGMFSPENFDKAGDLEEKDPTVEVAGEDPDQIEEITEDVADEDAEQVDDIGEGEEGEENVQIDENKLFRALADDLSSKGWDLEFGQDDEVSEEAFFNKFSEFADNAVKGSIDAWKDSLPEEVRNYVRFVSSGGDPEDYYSQLGVGSWRSFNVNTESGAEQMVRFYLSEVEGFDEDSVEDEVGMLADTDRLTKKAELYFNKLKSEADKKTEASSKAKENAFQLSQQAERKRLETLAEAVGKAKEINGFKFDAKKAYDSLTRNTVKVGDRHVPSFGAKFQKIWNEEPDKLLLLAHLLETDFDFSPIAKNIETKVTKKTRDLITKGKQAQKSRVASNQGRPIWEVGNF